MKGSDVQEQLLNERERWDRGSGCIQAEERLLRKESDEPEGHEPWQCCDSIKQSITEVEAMLSGKIER